MESGYGLCLFYLIALEARDDFDIIAHGKTLDKINKKVLLKELPSKIIEEHAEDRIKGFTERTVKPRSLKKISLDKTDQTHEHIPEPNRRTDQEIHSRKTNMRCYCT